MEEPSRHYQTLSLQQLAVSIQTNQVFLTAVNREQFTSGIAWAARNILELHAWTFFCLASEQNAKRFCFDSARDAIGSMDIPDELIKPGRQESFARVRATLLENAKRDSIDNPTVYFPVAKAAKTVGLKHFSKINMVLSKWAHPTAFNVLAGPKIGKTISPMFLQLGNQLAEEAIEHIRLYFSR